MGKKTKLLAGVVMATGLLDLYMTNRVYIKKKGIVLRDMALASIDMLRREKTDGTKGDAGEIHIEDGNAREMAPGPGSAGDPGEDAPGCAEAADPEGIGAEGRRADFSPAEKTGAAPEEQEKAAHNTHLGKRRNDDTWFSAGRGNLKWYNKRHR